MKMDLRRLLERRGGDLFFGISQYIFGDVTSHDRSGRQNG